MAINNLNAIEKALHLEEGSLQKAIDSEDKIDIVIPELIIKPKKDYDEYIDNYGKEKWDDGAETAEKRAVNKIAEKYKIELDDTRKTVENLVVAITEKNKVEFTKDPNDRITDLEDDNRILKERSEEWENKYNILAKETSIKESQLKIDNMILNELPNSDKINISREDALLIYKNKRNLSFNEKNELELKSVDGKQLKDDKLNLVNLKDDINSFVKPYLKIQKGGREGEDEVDTSKEGSYEAFEKEMKDKNITPGSEEFQTEQSKRINDGTLKI